MKHEDIISKLSLEDKASLLSGKNFWEFLRLLLFQYRFRIY